MPVTSNFASLKMAPEKNCLKLVKEKVELFVPSTFVELAAHIKEIVKYMKRLETNQLNTELEDALLIIDTMPHTFFSEGSAGIRLSVYGENLRNRCDCGIAPFLAMFADLCETTRSGLTAARRWLQADHLYASYVQLDIDELQRVAERLVYDQKKHRDQTYKTQYKLKHNGHSILRLQVELTNLKTREAEGIVSEEILQRELNDLSIKIEVKHKHQLDLVRNASNYHPQLMTEQFLDNSEELRILKTRLPLAKRQLSNVKKKLDYIGQRKTLLSKENMTYKCLQEQLAKMEVRRLHLLHALTCNRLALERAKRVYLFKTSPDAVKRIFNEQPIEINRLRLPGYRSKSDPFEKACTVIGSTIGGDWPRLYRKLPFYPPRGNATIDNDVETMTDSRNTNEDVAIRSLDKWRIYHTQAKVNDLAKALLEIKRFDIIKIMELELNPSPSPKPAEITLDIEEYLLPCLRQVLRFDQLRAINKI